LILLSEADKIRNIVAKPKKETLKLKAEKRKVAGRKVKRLRREGILPANIYGKKVKSCAVQLDLKTFLPVYQKVGETGIVNLGLKGETKARPVLIHNVQLDPVTDQPLHADFYQVDLKQKVTTEVPVEITGESAAVKEKGGILIQPLTEVEVEALPTELPDKFEVNVTGLKEIDDAVTVGDLKVPEGVKILTAAKQILAKIEPPAEEEETAPPEEEAPPEEAAEEAKPEEKEEEKPAEKKETETPPGEKKAKEKKSEKPSPEKKVAKAKKEK
jgi:large subunit ribosomal protein L25